MKASSRVKIRKIPFPSRKTCARGIEAKWENGQWVAVLGNQGMVGCGAFDLKLMEEHHQVLAIARGTVVKPLVTCDDLLEAKICGVTRLARRYGIRKGMTGRQALELLL